MVLVPQDVICHETAALFYLSAAVLEAYKTYALGRPPAGQAYRENIAAVVSAWVEGKERQQLALEWPQVQILICTNNLGSGERKQSQSHHAGMSPSSWHVRRGVLRAGVVPCNTKFTGCCVFPSQVFAFVATLVYVIHKVFSLLRWKSS